MKDESHDFENFMKRREDAARAFVRGDAVPLSRIVANVSPATFFGSNGGYEQDPAHVYAVYERNAEHFTSGESHFETLHMAAGDNIAYWVGFQRATVRLDKSTEAVPFDLRVTEVFRREGGDWKLIHRHADTLISESNEGKI